MHSVFVVLMYSSIAVLINVVSLSPSVDASDSEAGNHGHGTVTGLSNMVYFVHTGITINKPEYTFFQRVKRQVFGEDQDEKPRIKELIVKSNVISRFGTVVMESVIENSSPDDKEATFQVMLPDEAFMSNFTMVINGKFYQTKVVSKEEAQEQYEEAKNQNKTAGMVSNEDWEPEKRIRGMEKFKVSVNIAANSSIAFSLTYLELLRRRLGSYEQRISVRPNQIIEKLLMSICVYEEQGIINTEVHEPYGSNSLELLDVDIYDEAENMVEVSFSPSVERQKEMSTDDNIGISGDLVLRYDVDHSNTAGLTQVNNGFFVHFFSPDEFNVVLPKNVIFVIDISGSMGGSKIEQTRKSLLVILDQLHPDDMFMLVLFDNVQRYWPKSSDGTHLMTANSDNIKSAKEYVLENVKASGGTNINDALVMATQHFSAQQYGSNMIVFLTDGDPTGGETNTTKILENVRSATAGKVSIFSLGFGFDMKFAFLQAISYQNDGTARRIYDDLSANVQLQGFMEEIGSPTLYDVKMKFPTDLVISVTQVTFPQFFAGGELVVAGQLREEAPKQWNFEVTCTTDELITIPGHVIDNDIVLPPAVQDIYDPTFIERLYIYMKIKDQLRLELMTDDKKAQKEIREVALRLAIEYHMVTPLTSFLIVQDTPVDAPMMEEDMAMGMTPNNRVHTKMSSGPVSANANRLGCTNVLLVCMLYMIMMY